MSGLLALPSWVRDAIGAARAHYRSAFLFSLVINFLYLASPLYMLQVYDRVLQSSSVPTLVALTVMLVLALGVLGFLDNVRAKILARAGARIDRSTGLKVMAALVELRGRGAPAAPAINNALRDFDTVRGFITGPAATSLFDAPWVVLYILVLFLMHPVFGALGAFGAVLFAIIGYLNQRALQAPTQGANAAALEVYQASQSALNDAETVVAMGMKPTLLARWGLGRRAAASEQLKAGDTSAAYRATLRTLRLVLQSGFLGLGALLAINQITTPGAMIAASIIGARALGPIEQLVGQWRNLLTARQSAERVQAALDLSEKIEERAHELPAPKGRVDVEALSVMTPDRDAQILSNVTFSIAPGECVGVVGPSGVGKSTLARALVGLTPAAGGAVRLDGAEIDAWPREALGPHVGYMSQQASLFAGTIWDNITRFAHHDADADAKAVAAAKAAGAHEMILRLPKGYDTPVSGEGAPLSAGQRQQVALARALYGDPVLVVLDEPNAHLDQAGEEALVRALAGLRERGATVVMIAHRAGALNATDKLLVLMNGMLAQYGPSDQVRTALAARAGRPELRTVAGRKEQGA